MTSFRLGAAITGSAGVLGLLLFHKREQLLLRANSPDYRSAAAAEGTTRSRHKWDYDWDHMAPLKDGVGKEVAKSKATRTLILIRHGQYVWDPHDADKRILTELGRRQAAITGKRLKELGHSYAALHYSTMPRATETAQIIMQTLPDVPSRSCDLMREGAPIRPEPMSSTWKPDAVVRTLPLVLSQVFSFVFSFLFEEFFRDGPRIEAAFRKYFHRAPPSQTEDSIEVLVCHANVIRYFVCR